MQLWKRLRSRREAKRQAKQQREHTLLVQEIREKHWPRISAYRAQRALETIQIHRTVDEKTRAVTAEVLPLFGKPGDLTPRQRRRMRHKFNHHDGLGDVRFMEIWDG